MILSRLWRRALREDTGVTFTCGMDPCPHQQKCVVVHTSTQFRGGAGCTGRGSSSCTTCPLARPLRSRDGSTVKETQKYMTGSSMYTFIHILLSHVLASPLYNCYSELLASSLPVKIPLGMTRKWWPTKVGPQLRSRAEVTALACSVWCESGTPTARHLCYLGSRQQNVNNTSHHSHPRWVSRSHSQSAISATRGRQ